MSRKYVAQVNNQNFVYPNQNLEEYDVEIIHDINDNCVSGTTSSFSATTVTSTSISFTHFRSFNMNGAEPFTTSFISPLYEVPYLSIHCQVPNQPYMNTWKLVDYENILTATPKTVVITNASNSFTIVPSQFGLTSFSSGVYSFEFRFIGQNCLYKICSSLTINLTTPTPTPTPSPTPTSTPTGPTPTPTPTATIAPVGQCYCFPIVVTGTTIPGPEGGTIATLQYNDCYGVLTARSFTVGPGTYYQCIQVDSSVVQYDPIGTTGIDQSYLTLSYLTGNCNTGYVCTGYTPASTATPTPTPTATGSPATNTPTPTPTATSTPTPTPTPTSTVTFFSDITSDPKASGAEACGSIMFNPDPTVGNGTTFCNSTTLTNPSYGSLPTGTYYIHYNFQYVQVSLTNGNNTVTVTSACQSCPTPTPTPTATATPTPTPTATPIEYDYYTADVSDCAACGTTTETIEVGFIAGTPVTPGRFYIPVGGPDGLAYQINSSTFPSGPVLILTNAFGSFTSCASACSA